MRTCRPVVDNPAIQCHTPGMPTRVQRAKAFRPVGSSMDGGGIRFLTPFPPKRRCRSLALCALLACWLACSASCQLSTQSSSHRLPEDASVADDVLPHTELDDTDTVNVWYFLHYAQAGLWATLEVWIVDEEGHVLDRQFTPITRRHPVNIVDLIGSQKSLGSRSPEHIEIVSLEYDESRRVAGARFRIQPGNSIEIRYLEDDSVEHNDQRHKLYMDFGVNLRASDNQSPGS